MQLGTQAKYFDTVTTCPERNEAVETGPGKARAVPFFGAELLAQPCGGEPPGDSTRLPRPASYGFPIYTCCLLHATQSPLVTLNASVLLVSLGGAMSMWVLSHESTEARLLMLCEGLHLRRVG